jgi:hypothetical protein
MVSQASISERILEVVRANPDCTLEEVAQQLPDFGWSEVFVAVDHLSRSGRLRLIRGDSFRFTTSLRLP